MPKKRRIYASSLNNVAICPKFDWEDTGDNPYAERGTAIHEALETQNPSKLPTDDLIPYEYGLSLLENMWKDHFDSPPLEYHEQAFKLPGIGNCKIDYNAQGRSRVLVTDWKTGVTAHHAETDLQGKAYALAVFQRFEDSHSYGDMEDFEGLQEVVICFADLDIKRTSEHTFHRSEVAQLHEDVYSVYYAALTAKAGKPCELCGKCAHKTSCKESAENVRTALVTVDAPAVPDMDQVRNWTPDQQGEFLDRMKQVEKVLKKVKEELRATASPSNLPTGYFMHETKGNRQIMDVWHTVEILREMELPEPVIDSCLKLSLGDLEKAYVEKMRFEIEENIGKLPRGAIAQARKEFYTALDERGLLSRSPSVSYLKKSPTKKQLN